MRYEKLEDGSYNMRIREPELRAMQFVLRFMVNLFHSRVFTGRFMGTVTRLHNQIDRMN